MSVDLERGEWRKETLPASWCWADFDAFWTDHTDAKRKLPQKFYVKEGAFAVVDQGADLIGGYTNDASKRSLAPLPTIIFGDHTRAVKYIDRPFVQGADGVRVLCAAPGIEPMFAYHALRCVRLPDKGYSRHFKFLKATSFPVAPLLEQRRIVEKIDSLSAKSERARNHLDHIPRLVEKYKQAILAAAFWDYSKGENTRLGDFSEFVTSGSRGWAKFYSENGARFIRVGNVQRANIALNWNDTQRVSPPDGSEGQRTGLRANDLVITITADLGRVGLIPSDIGTAYVNQHVALVRLKAPDNARFVAWYLASDVGQQQLLEQNRGATRAGLGLDDIKAVRVPVASPAAQRATIRVVETAFAWIDRLAAEATSARKLIDHLDHGVLAKAFRGELVPQDPSDEPASVLLERIRSARSSVSKKPRR